MPATRGPRLSVARRDDAVLLVIDIQERLAAVMPHREPVRVQTEFLVEVATLLGVPIVVTRQYPKGLGDLEPRLAQAIERAETAGASVAHADKLAFDCLADEGIAEALAGIGRSQLLVCGMETHICVTQTVLHARRLGLEAMVAADAVCSRSDAASESALARMRAADAVITTSESIAYELVGAAGTDEFRGLLRAVKARDAALATCGS